MFLIGLMRFVVKYKLFWCKFFLWKIGSVNFFKNRYVILIVDEFCGDLKFFYILSNNVFRCYE